MADSAFDIFYEPEGELERSFSDEELVFTEEEEEKIQKAKDQYPTDRSAVMHVLWIAQKKFGWLAPEVIKLVAEELDMDPAQVYGVATFYTQYYKHEKGEYVLDVCTASPVRCAGATTCFTTWKRSWASRPARPRATGFSPSARWSVWEPAARRRCWRCPTVRTCII
jgi:NADH:ubiquinone oxidoreductase subunit E